MYSKQKLFKDSPTVRKNSPKVTKQRIKAELTSAPKDSKCIIYLMHPLTGKKLLCHLYKDADNNIRLSRSQRILDKELNGYLILDYVINQTIL